MSSSRAARTPAAQQNTEDNPYAENDGSIGGTRGGSIASESDEQQQGSFSPSTAWAAAVSSEGVFATTASDADAALYSAVQLEIYDLDDDSGTCCIITFAA